MVKRSRHMTASSKRSWVLRNCKCVVIDSVISRKSPHIARVTRATSLSWGSYVPVHGATHRPRSKRPQPCAADVFTTAILRNLVVQVRMLNTQFKVSRASCAACRPLKGPNANVLSSLGVRTMVNRGTASLVKVIHACAAGFLDRML